MNFFEPVGYKIIWTNTKTKERSFSLNFQDKEYLEDVVKILEKNFPLMKGVVSVAYKMD